MNNNVKSCDDNKQIPGNMFWKKNTHIVPGRASRRKELINNIQNKQTLITSFQNFQDSISDIWNVNDNDDKDFFDVKNTTDVISTHKQETFNTSSSKLSSQQSKVSEVQPKTHKSVMNTSGIGEKSDTEVNKTKKTITSSFNTGTDPKKCTQKLKKIEKLLSAPVIDLNELRQLSWSGIPPEIRPNVWRLLANYLPTDLKRQEEALERKRLDYWNLIFQYYDCAKWDDGQHATYRQIHIDIPRMSQLVILFRQRTVQEMFERILFLWAILHPASGYVQGMNDLVTPFFVIFLKEGLESDEEVMQLDINSLSIEKRGAIEADSFWCLSKFLDNVQDNYTFAQLGIQQKVNRLKELTQRIDGTLHKHLQNNEIDYIQFSYRWMNNLLTRELPLECTIRLWDTYLAEADSFALLHEYICVAFLQYWRKELLQEKDFQGLMLTLQNLPTKKWTSAEIAVVIAEAYKLKYSFADAPNHFLHVGSC